MAKHTKSKAEIKEQLKTDLQYLNGILSMTFGTGLNSKGIKRLATVKKLLQKS